MRCISSVVPKSDIAVTDFTIKNEPMFGYMPGSPERIELEAALVKYSDVTEDVPIVIGGKEYRTDDVQYQVMVNLKNDPLIRYILMFCPSHIFVFWFWVFWSL